MDGKIGLMNTSWFSISASRMRFLCTVMLCAGVVAGTAGESRAAVQGQTFEITVTSTVSGQFDGVLGFHTLALFSFDPDTGASASGTYTQSGSAITIISARGTNRMGYIGQFLAISYDPKQLPGILGASARNKGTPAAIQGRGFGNTGDTFTFSGEEQELAAGPAPVNLRSAGSFAILSKTGVTNVPTSAVTGDVGASPITGAAILLTCSEVVGNIYSVDAAGPQPCTIINATKLSTAVSDMQTAYTDAAGRPATVTELSAGNIGGLILAPGVYKWSSNVTIPTDVTFSGSAQDVWILQIAGNLELANARKVLLKGGADPRNIFWQVGGQATLGTTSQFNGTILSQTLIAMNTDAAINGRLLAQTAVTLQKNVVKRP